jgi:excisionase family DNA binding protein
MSKTTLSNPVYLTPAEVSRLTGLGLKTLEAMRAKRRGPPYYKVGRLVRYGLNDVYVWIERERFSTRDEDGL